MLDLAELRFVVNTEQLDIADQKLGKLAETIGALDAPMQNLNKNTKASGEAINKLAKDTTVLAGANDKLGESVEKAAKRQRTVKVEAEDGLGAFDKLKERLENTTKDLTEGFTRSESSILNVARNIGVTTEQMAELQSILKRMGSLLKDPFDSAIGSVRSITQEYDKLQVRAELASKEIFLSTKQLSEYSRLANEIKMKMHGEGKLIDESGNFQDSKNLVEFNNRLQEQQTLYLQTAKSVNALTEAEKIRQTQAKKALQEKAALEHEEAQAIQRTLELEKQKAEIAAGLRQRYSSSGTDTTQTDSFQDLQRNAKKYNLAALFGDTYDQAIKGERELEFAALRRLDTMLTLQERYGTAVKNMTKEQKQEALKAIVEESTALRSYGTEAVQTYQSIQQAKKQANLEKIVNPERTRSANTELQDMNAYYKNIQESEAKANAEVNAILQRMQQTQDKLQAKAQYMQQGFSATLSAQAAVMKVGGVQAEVIDNFLKKAQAMEKVASAASKVAKAEQYLTDVEGRLDAQLKEGNQALQERHTNQLEKVRRSIEALNLSTQEAEAYMQRLDSKIRKVASQQNSQQINNLARALSVQLGDVGISLASGQNPFIVLLQQGDQMRAMLEQSGVEAKDLSGIMSGAFGVMTASVKNLGIMMQGFLVGAINTVGQASVNAAKSVAQMGMRFAEMVPGVDLVSRAFQKMQTDVEASNSGVAKFLFSLGSGITSVMTRLAPFLVAVAGIGAIALAIPAMVGIVSLLKQNESALALNKALATTGATIGIVKDQAVAMTKAMADGNGSSLKYSEAMQVVISKSFATKENIVAVTKSIVEMNRLTGKPLAELAENFKNMSEKPVEALLKLVETQGFVSAASIKAAEDAEKAGKMHEAASIAVNAAVASNKAAADQIYNQMSGWDRLLHDLGNTWNFFKEKLASFGDSGFMNAIIGGIRWIAKTVVGVAYAADAGATALGTLIEALQASRSGGKVSVLDVLEKGMQKQKDIAESYGKVIDDLSGATKKVDTSQVAVNATMAAGADAYKSYSTTMKDVLKDSNKELWIQQQLTKAKNEGEAAVAANLLKPDEHAKNMRALEAKLRKEETDKAKRDKDKADRDELAAIQKQQQLILDLAEKEGSWTATHAQTEQAIYLQYLRDIETMGEKQADLLKNARTDKLMKIQPWYINQEKEINKIHEARNKILQAESKYADDLDNSESVLAAARARNEEAQKAIGLTKEQSIEEKAVASIAKVRLDYEKSIQAIRSNKDMDLVAQEASILKSYKTMMNKIAAIELDKDTEIIKVQRKQQEEMITEFSSGLAEGISNAFFDGTKTGTQYLKDSLRKILANKLKLSLEVQINAWVNTLFTQSGVGTQVMQALSGDTKSLVSTLSSLGSAGTTLASLLGGTTGSGVAAATASQYSLGSAALGNSLSTGSAGTGLSVAGTSASAATTATGASAGAMASTAAIYAAAAYMAYKMGSKWYDEGFGKSSASNIGSSSSALLMGGPAAIGKIDALIAGGLEKLGLSEKWASLLSGSTFISKLFGRAAPKVTASGIQGTFTDGTFSGTSYQDIYEKGGIFRSSKSYTNTSELDAASAQYMQSLFDQTKFSITTMAETLGLADTALDDFSYSMKLNLLGLTDEEMITAIEEEFGKISDAMAAAYIDMDTYARSGETATETLTRLANVLGTMNQMFDNLGYSLFETSLAGFTAADAFANLFGGIEEATTALSTYYEDYYSEEERIANSTKAMSAAFAVLGKTLPDSKDQLREWVDAAQKSGDTELMANLITLSSTYSSLVEEQEAAAEESISLMSTLLELQGKTNEIRALELASLSDSERAIQEQIYALQDAAEVLDAYNTAVSDTRSAVEDVASAEQEIADIRTEATENYISLQEDVASALENVSDIQKAALQEYIDVGESLLEFVNSYGTTANTSFKSILEAARSGDLEAAGNLQSAAETAIEDARDNASTLAEANAAQAKILAQVKEIADSYINIEGSSLQDRILASNEDLITATQELADVQADLASALVTALKIGAGLTASDTDLVSEYNSAVSSKNLADAKLQSAVDVLEVIQKYVGTLPNAVGNMTSELVLYSESVKSAVQQNTQAIQGLNISSDVKSQIQGIQEGISTAIASVQSSDMQASEIQLALSNAAALSSLVNEVAVSSLSSGDKNALLNASQDATSYLNLEAATSTLLTDDQRSALEAATSSVVKVMQDTLASGSLSSTDASMLSTSDATVQAIVQSLLQNSQITAEQESLLKSMQDTSTVQQEVQSLVSALSSVSTDTGTSTSDALYSITSASASDTSTDTAIDSDDTEVVVQLKILNERIILLETAAKASALYDAKMLKILERVTPDGDSISTTAAS